jgi:serine/threonine-protein kinase CHEK2
MKTFCGTPNYLAPEVLITRGAGCYTNKVDNWSLGVILYICLSGYPPFNEEDTSVSLENQIKRGMYNFKGDEWSSVSIDAIDLIRKLMCIEPENRFSLDEVLEHKWIKNDFDMKLKANRLMYPENESDASMNEGIGAKKRNLNEVSSMDSQEEVQTKRLKESNSNSNDTNYP